MLPVPHVRRIMIRTALWWTRPRDDHDRDMLSSLFFFSYIVLPPSLFKYNLSFVVVSSASQFDGLSILQGHFLWLWWIFGYVALYPRLSTCHDNEDIVLFVKYWRALSRALSWHIPTWTSMTCILQTTTLIVFSSGTSGFRSVICSLLSSHSQGIGQRPSLGRECIRLLYYVHVLRQTKQ